MNSLRIGNILLVSPKKTQKETGQGTVALLVVSFRGEKISLRDAEMGLVLAVLWIGVNTAT